MKRKIALKMLKCLMKDAEKLRKEYGKPTTEEQRSDLHKKSYISGKIATIAVIEDIIAKRQERELLAELFKED